jgi:uncharacterized protein YutE (UPF0331/DUF86 family)
MIYPNLKFDSISLTLFAIATLFFLITDIENLISSTKRIKIGSFELELTELKKSTEKIENELASTERPAKISGPFQENNYSLDVKADLPTTVLKISIEIERTLNRIYRITHKTEAGRPLAVNKLIDSLFEKQVLDNETWKLLRQFWQVRNNVVHSTSSMSDNEMLAFSDLGLRLLKILNTTEDTQLQGVASISRLS